MEGSFAFKYLVITEYADRFLVFRPERNFSAAFGTDRDEFLAHVDPHADRVFSFRL
jgi:hypothetical protein